MEMTSRSDAQPSGPRFVVPVSREKYDFVAHRGRFVTKPTNALESTGHLIKGCLGGGILGMHEAYMKCGLWTALGTTILFGFYISYCVYTLKKISAKRTMQKIVPYHQQISNLLITSAHLLCEKLHIPQMSYPDVAQASLEIGPFPSLRKYGNAFRYAVDVVICLDLFGACACYEIIIAKTIQLLVWHDDEASQDSLMILRMYILALLLPILLLCMITSLKYLAPFSLIADFFIVACVISTIVYGQQKAPPLSQMPAFKDWLGFFEFAGVVVFSMEGIGVSLPIENNMKDPSQFLLVLCAGMTVVVSFVMATGFFGYWGFGEECIAPVTLNFPNELFPTILKILIAIMIFVTFALNFWAPFNLCWYYLAKRHPASKHWFWERVYRAIIILFITAIAVAFPNIGNLMGLLGAFCLSNMGFIFPAFIDLLVVWEDPGLGKFNWRLYKNIGVCLLGILLLIAGTYSNAKGLFESLS